MSYDYRANSKLFTHWDFLEDDFHRACLVMIFTVPTVHFFVQETIQALNVKNPLDHHSEAKFLRSFEYMGAGSGGRGQGAGGREGLHVLIRTLDMYKENGVFSLGVSW